MTESWSDFLEAFNQDKDIYKVGDKRGYVRVYVPYHPHSNKGWLLEHRLVSELMIGSFLPREIVVHHINEIKTDNRPVNLYLTTPSEHTTIHKTGETRGMLENKRHRTAIRAKRKKSGSRVRGTNGRFVAKDHKGPVQKRLVSKRLSGK